jgi:hypothetical protein
METKAATERPRLEQCGASPRTPLKQPAAAPHGDRYLACHTAARD